MELSRTENGGLGKRLQDRRPEAFCFSAVDSWYTGRKCKDRLGFIFITQTVLISPARATIDGVLACSAKDGHVLYDTTTARSKKAGASRYIALLVIS